jgi:hypothetical protein
MTKFCDSIWKKLSFMKGNDIDKQEVFRELKRYNRPTATYPDKRSITFRQYQWEWKLPYKLLVVSNTFNYELLAFVDLKIFVKNRVLDTLPKNHFTEFF